MPNRNVCDPEWSSSRETDAYLVISAWYVIRTIGGKEQLHPWLGPLECLARHIESEFGADGLVYYRGHGTMWFDTYKFQGADAYSNAADYRAFRCMADLETLAGRMDLARRYQADADRIKAVYFNLFYNPETGVLAGWREEGGKLHDYMFPWVNGFAICQGLVPPENAKAILQMLLAKLDDVGFHSYQLGLPTNLKPMSPDDYEYVGGKPFIRHGQTEMPPAMAIDNMLSRFWVTNKCPEFYENTLAQVKPTGLPCRMTEANDYLRGITNASDAFASALWALDYMHWWAARGLAGINFHNNQWLKTDTFYLDKTNGAYQINPKAYAIRAFDLGSDGWVEPVDMVNSNDLNLTAYPVGDATNLGITIINKEHGPAARGAAVNIAPMGFPFSRAEVMFMTAANGDATAKTGITLGGSLITNNAPWQGQWTTLPTTTNNLCTLIVPATSAAVVKLTAE